MYVRNQLNKDYMKIDPRVHREQTRKRWKGKEPGSRTEMFRARNKRDRIRNATSIRYFARYNIDTRTRVSSLVTYIRTYVGRDRERGWSIHRYVNDADIIQVRYMEARILAWTSASR